ncbi:hypothetical protein [Corynebacterium riegelii]|uniref:hypothetical protein n=1 Tax=Corynebacterium riegelii TaxID=156976 RepID=UPI0023EF8CD4|nr:hypothetical protein [Corynebacterium riegelii]
MKYDNKLVYRAASFLVILLSLAGAALAAFDLIRASLTVLGIALAFLPALGHLRMREQLSAIRRMPQTPGDSFDAQPLFEQISSIEHHVATLLEHQSQSKSPSDELVSTELQEVVNQLRRESRMARIAAAQITGKL